jgi:hypothetical protein
MTMANAPLWDGTAESLLLFLPNGEAEYFYKEGWTRGLRNCLSGKSVEASLPATNTKRLRKGAIATKQSISPRKERSWIASLRSQ